MTRPYRHWQAVSVRWGDMDAYGHVNNAVYFTYCESARMSFFDALALEETAAAATDGAGEEGEGASRPGVALAQAALDFRQQVRHPAVLEVGLRVARIGGASFTLEYGLYREGTDELVAEGSSVVVWMDYGAGRSRPLPDGLREALAAYVVPA